MLLRPEPSGHIMFIKRRVNVDATSDVTSTLMRRLYKGHVPTWNVCLC